MGESTWMQEEERRRVSSCDDVKNHSVELHGEKVQIDITKLWEDIDIEATCVFHKKKQTCSPRTG